MNIAAADSKENTEYIVFIHHGVHVITKELATADDLFDEFECIPDGKVGDRIIKCIKITRLNRKKFLEEEKNIDIKELLPDIDSKMAKKIRFEWVERSW